jgi:SNF2 family DNA or RNA helicase
VGVGFSTTTTGTAMPNIYISDNAFCVECEFWDNHYAQAIPDRKWNKKEERWEAPITLTNAKYIVKTYAHRDIFKPAMTKIREMLALEQAKPLFPSWYAFKNPPMKCQTEALNKSFTQDSFAFIMDMGTGKSFTTINFGCAKAMMGEINGMLIVCDTGGKPVWMDEFALHCPLNYTMYVMEAGEHKKALQWCDEPSDCFKVLVVGVESLSTGPYAKKVAAHFLLKHTAYMAIDESTSIKNPSSKRTKICWDLGEYARYRSILNGTPVDEGIENLFAQFRFLDWRIIGMKNFTLFRNRYCIMGGFEGRKIVGYDHTDELFERIAPYIYEVKITDVEDMPDRVYETVYCDPTKEQKKAMNELGDPMMTTTQGDRVLEVETVLERTTRYQQIVGGYFPYDLTEEEHENRRGSDPSHGIMKIEGKNPKMLALIDIIEKLPSSRKVIIWARFTKEREDILEWFNENRNGQYIDFGSGQTAIEKSGNMAQFQNDHNCRYWITSQKISSKAVTLTAATVAIYYSNSFSYNEREQSERRPWRKGQKHPCLYIDITMNHRVDKHIIKALKDKKSLADFVMQRITEETS